ncbi:MAG: tRNA pseudouridine(55) synthase TruB [Flavobacteriaceae bacterium]|nr:tRNA pseudouridine(55) synthase TruB [Flavobacteriaceae bacterium]
MKVIKEKFINGEVILIDKPLNWTSFQVVNKIRWIIKNTFGLKKIKVGHAGTLDPLASGLLILCTGKMTKQIEQFMGQEKEYVGTISLGATTPSYDLETEINQYFPTKHIDKELLESTLYKFTGTIDQKPPIFSALKKEGKRLYEFAREGLNIDVPSRKVVIRNFEITQIKFPEIDFKVNCSKGTYIRSLVHDYGKSINSGAYLSALRRTKIGEFSVENAIQMEDFEKLLEK